MTINHKSNHHHSQQAQDDKNAQRNDVLHCLWFNSAASRCERHVCGIHIICGLQKHIRCQDSRWSCHYHCKIKHPVTQCHHTVTSWNSSKKVWPYIAVTVCTNGSSILISLLHNSKSGRKKIQHKSKSSA